MKLFEKQAVMLQPDPLPKPESFPALLEAQTLAARVDEQVAALQSAFSTARRKAHELEVSAPDLILRGETDVGSLIADAHAAREVAKANLQAAVAARGAVSERCAEAEAKYRTELEDAALAELKRLRAAMAALLHQVIALNGQMASVIDVAMERGAGQHVRRSAPTYPLVDAQSMFFWLKNTLWEREDRQPDPDRLIVRVIAPSAAIEVWGVVVGETCSIPRSAGRRLLRAGIVEVVDPRGLPPDLPDPRAGQRLLPHDPAAAMQTVRFVKPYKSFGIGAAYSAGELASFKAPVAQHLVLTEGVAEYALDEAA